MNRTMAALVCGIVVCTACDRSTDRLKGDDADAGNSGVTTAARTATRMNARAEALPPARDACELIPADEVAAVLGEPVEARRETLEKPDESVCAYGPPGGWSVLYVTAYWRGGREEWEARQAALGSGRVSGIGDAAHYGGILPSLVLSGDVLLEFAMPLLPDEEVNFPILARAAVSRL
jgi:hypothetical protein